MGSQRVRDNLVTKNKRASQVALVVKNPPANAGDSRDGYHRGKGGVEG